MSRDDNVHEATRRTLSVLLRKIDGFNSAGNRTIVICATNRRQDIDKAFLSRYYYCYYCYMFVILNYCFVIIIIIILVLLNRVYVFSHNDVIITNHNYLLRFDKKTNINNNNKNKTTK